MVKSLTIGLVDDGVATWNPVSDGNLLVTGGAGCGRHGSGASVQSPMLVRPLVHRVGLASARVLDGFRMPVRRAAEHSRRV